MTKEYIFKVTKTYSIRAGTEEEASYKMMSSEDLDEFLVDEDMTEMKMVTS